MRERDGGDADHGRAGVRGRGEVQGDFAAAEGDLGLIQGGIKGMGIMGIIGVNGLIGVTQRALRSSKGRREYQRFF